MGKFLHLLLYVSLSFEFFTVTYVLSLQSKDSNFAELLKAPASGYLGYLRYTLAASWSREWGWQLLLIWPTTEVWKRDPEYGFMAGAMAGAVASA